MKQITLISILLISLFCNGQNEAFYLSQGGLDLKRVNLETYQIIDYYSFSDTTVRKTTLSESINLTTSELNPIKKSEIVQSPDTLVLHFPRVPTIKTYTDSINMNNKWYSIQIILTDDHFVGGSPNRVTTDIIVQDLGVIYSSSNWINEHKDIMICHNDGIKQNLLTSAFEYVKENQPHIIEKSRLTKIINLTQNLQFHNIIDTLKKKWLTPKNDLIIAQTHSEIESGRLNYSVTIKNISDKGYFFLWESEYGPGKVEQLINDKRVVSKIDGDYHGTRYHYNFKKMSESIYLKPSDEITFNFMPSLRLNCETCNQNKYFGFQVSRYGVDFFYWIFTEEITYNDLNYRLYHLREIN
jgi:hypothetical protein